MDDVWAAVMLLAGGLFAGGAATFAWSRVPIWRRMAVPQFLRDFEATIRWTDKVQPALLLVGAATAVAFAITAEGAARVFAAVGAAGFVLVLIASLAVLVPLQRRIIATSPDEADAVEAMRMRWFSGNLGRSILSVTSFALMVVAAVI
jgi:anthrone oxygenase-like protein